MNKRARIAGLIGAAALLGVMLACSDINKQNGPIQLIVTITQNISVIDVEPGAFGCDISLGTVDLRSLLLQGGQSIIPPDDRFNDIQLRSYRVSYIRTDGGHLVPEPFVRTISGTLFAGGSQSLLNEFQAFVPGALSQAPFAALFPSNGGRDPETGRPFVEMDIVIEVFGETLAGERVSGSARAPLTFCFHCNGCR